MSREAGANGPRRPCALRNLTKALALACLLSFSILCLLFLAPIPPHVPDLPALGHPFGGGPPHPPPPPPPTRPRPEAFSPDDQQTTSQPAFPPNPNPTPCVGPRGVTVAEGQDLPLRVYTLPNTTFAIPTIGSLQAIGLQPSWLTAEARYGPYGYGEDKTDYGFQRVNWSTVTWGRLQHNCVVSNRKSLPGRPDSTFNNSPRFHYSARGEPPEPPRAQTGRQAIVLRAWSTYKYTPEDMWNIRSIVSEANLATGGRYEVILLVDVKDDEKGPLIHRDDQLYTEMLRAVVPMELQDLTVLFHSSLQEDWYAKVGQIKPVFQIMQPLQLFAHFYPEYDHYWQIELDTRFTGHVGDMLHAFHEFARAEPYKQAVERASWTYMPAVHGNWSDLFAAVNATLEGRATWWGPVRIKNFEPMFGAPPMKPREDNFTWGVGSDADLLLLNSIDDVRRIETEEDWVFLHWYSQDFDRDVPRWISTPAQARASWQLLESIHTIQHHLGLRVPSESTLPSFAMWNGMKVINAPHPKYQFPERNVWELNRIFNGKFPAALRDGLAWGPGKYHASTVNFFTRPTTFAWWSSLPNHMFDFWFGTPPPPREGEEVDDVHFKQGNLALPLPPPELPHFMVNVSGVVYTPPMILHPRKTNNYVSP